MKTKIEIADNEVVQINNIEEYKEIYDNLRSASSTTYEDWMKEFGWSLEFPLYLEGTTSVTRGYSIGTTNKRKPYQKVLQLSFFRK